VRRADIRFNASDNRREHDMDESLMEQLLHEGESSSLDYKRDQYPFAGASDDEKGELLKDILAFANGWRHAEAYILIGVEEVTGGRSTVVGVSDHIPENDLQQFVNSKTNRPVTFSYRAFPFEGKQIGVITVPRQDRPLWLTRHFGKLQKQVVYYRQGTTTAVATPDDIARMGTPVEIKKLLEGQRDESKKEQVRVTLGLDCQHSLFADIYNFGDIPVYVKEVALCKEVEPAGVMRVPLLPTLSLPDGRGAIEHVVPGQKNYDLPVRKEVCFVLPRSPSPAIIQGMSTCPPEKVWLSVSTFGGEIYRVKGEEVQPLLVLVAKLWEKLAEAAKPRNLQVAFYTSGSGDTKVEVGKVKAQLVRPGGTGPVQVGFEPISGFSISREQANQLGHDLVDYKAIGRLGEYEWRVE
jgi:hypothetical protein